MKNQRNRLVRYRAQWWDYRWPHAYYVTINTANRAPIFGSVQNGKVLLTPLGVLADLFWNEIPCHQPHVQLGAYVVMPNHLHGILLLETPIHTTSELEKRAEISDTTKKDPRMSAISPKKFSLSTVVRSYKSAVTYHANRLQIKNGWQPRFFDRIIRNEAEFNKLTTYIRENPLHWPEPSSDNNGLPENSYPLM